MNADPSEIDDARIRRALRAMQLQRDQLAAELDSRGGGGSGGRSSHIHLADGTTGLEGRASQLEEQIERIRSRRIMQVMAALRTVREDDFRSGWSHLWRAITGRLEQGEDHHGR